MVLYAIFQPVRAFAGWRTLTAESSLISGCSQGHENCSKKLWPDASSKHKCKEGIHSLKKKFQVNGLWCFNL